MENETHLKEKFNDYITIDPRPYFLYSHDVEGIFTFVSENITELLGQRGLKVKKHSHRKRKT